MIYNTVVGGTMTTLDALRSVSIYYIPAPTIKEVAINRGLDAEAEATEMVISSPAYSLAKADLYRWLSEAPSVRQGDVSQQIPDKETRERLAMHAQAIYGAYAPNDDTNACIASFGYKGEDL
ncbi:MAG: hypothetical protein LBG17_04690 [Bacteroidales bacterium]|jgi:hypothetical protein|nr:hypothetical protein [Bacteroidales bacterium]